MGTVMHKEEKRKIKKALISFIGKRFHLVFEYHIQCKKIDTKIIEFVEDKIKLEMEYIANYKRLLAKFTEQEQDEFILTSKHILSSYIDTIHETTIEHQSYLLQLQETLDYLKTENE